MEQNQKTKSLKISISEIHEGNRVPKPHEKEYMKNFLNTLSEKEKKAVSYTDWSDERVGEACLALYKMHMAFDNSTMVSAVSGINIMSNKMSRMGIKALSFDLILNNTQSSGLDSAISFSLKEVPNNTIESDDNSENITYDNLKSNNSIDTVYQNNLEDNFKNIGKLMKVIYHQLPDNISSKNQKDSKGREALFFTAYALSAINESLIVNSEHSTINLEDLSRVNDTGEEISIECSYQMDIHIKKIDPELDEDNKKKNKNKI